MADHLSNVFKLQPYTEEEINAVEDGFGWNIPLKGKSLVLNCEIFCNSKDIDDRSWSQYVHYNKGKQIFDECPKELHIKRGRDYDFDDDLIFTENGFMTRAEYEGRLKPQKIINTAKVKFKAGGSYWYLDDKKTTIGDLVYVDGAKEDSRGKVIALSTSDVNPASQNIIEIIGHVEEYYPEEIEKIWSSYKAKDRKEYLKKLNLMKNLQNQNL